MALGGPAREERTRGLINPPSSITGRGPFAGSRHFLKNVCAAFLVALFIAGSLWFAMMAIVASKVGPIDSGLYGDRTIVRAEAIRNAEGVQHYRTR